MRSLRTMMAFYILNIPEKTLLELVLPLKYNKALNGAIYICHSPIAICFDQITLIK